MIDERGVPDFESAASEVREMLRKTTLPFMRVSMTAGQAIALLEEVDRLSADVRHMATVVSQLMRFGAAEETNSWALKSERDDAMAILWGAERHLPPIDKEQLDLLRAHIATREGS